MPRTFIVSAGRSYVAAYAEQEGIDLNDIPEEDVNDAIDKIDANFSDADADSVDDDKASSS